MIARLKVENPSLKADFNGDWELSFKVNQESVFGAKNTILALKNNNKQLEIELDFTKKKRTLDQNALLWQLLTIYSKEIAGGRKNGENTAEDLYYKAINKYGQDTIVLVEEGAEQILKKVYKKVYIIDKTITRGKTYSKCRCVIGSSNYDTKEMSDLIDGVLDEMSRAGINTDEKIMLENEWREYGRR